MTGFEGAPGAPQPDEAIFTLERVPRGRGQRSIAAIVLATAGLAVFGLVTTRQQTESAIVATSTPFTARITVGNWGSPKKGDDTAILNAGAGRLLTLDTQASEGFVFIHGDVYTRGAQLVVVTIEDAQHRTLDRRTLQMPGGSTAFRTGPNDRFSLAFHTTGMRSKQPAWVSADAYDSAGVVIASARSRVGTG